MLNSVDPDLLASSEPTDLNLPRLQMQGISGFSWTWGWVCRKTIFVILHVGSFMVLSYFLNHSSSQCTQMSWPFFSCTQMHPIMGCTQMHLITHPQEHTPNFKWMILYISQFLIKSIVQIGFSFKGRIWHTFTMNHSEIVNTVWMEQICSRLMGPWPTDWFNWIFFYKIVNCTGIVTLILSSSNIGPDTLSIRKVFLLLHQNVTVWVFIEITLSQFQWVPTRCVLGKK